MVKHPQGSGQGHRIWPRMDLANSSDHAVRTGSVQAVHETDDGTTIALRGGQVIPLTENFDTILVVLGWHRRNEYQE